MKQTQISPVVFHVIDTTQSTGIEWQQVGALAFSALAVGGLAIGLVLVWVGR